MKDEVNNKTNSNLAGRRNVEIHINFGGRNSVSLSSLIRLTFRARSAHAYKRKQMWKRLYRGIKYYDRVVGYLY